MGNNLYILGAGASIGSNRFPQDRYSPNKKMPSGRSFFHDVFEIENPSKDGLDFFNLLDMTYEHSDLKNLSLSDFNKCEYCGKQ